MIVNKSPWVQHGFWNTLEHGLTRALDALSTLFLLWVLTPEKFSELAMAQAIATACLIFFISPETTLYRDYAQWKKEGPTLLASRIFALRTFDWLKVFIFILLSWILSRSGSNFWALIWAFSLILAPQVMGADREFIRLNLELKILNWLTLYQKLSLFIGTTIVAFAFSSRFEFLALVALFSLTSSAYLAQKYTRKILFDAGASLPSLSGEEGAPPLQTLKYSFQSFSLWRHFLGVIQSWVLTMDLFFLGVFGFPARGIGLYSTVSKISNFSQAGPIALSNLFSVWVGRRDGDQKTKNQKERKELKKFTLFLLFGSFAQAALVWGLSDWIFRFFSHGRWSEPEIETMKKWLAWTLTGSALFGSTFLYSSWLLVRTSALDLLVRVYIPWGLLALGLYSTGTYFQGFTTAAMVSIPVALIHIALLWVYFRRKVV